MKERLIKFTLCSSPVVVFTAPVISWSLEEVNEQDLLGEIKVAIARPFPDQEALRWGDGNVIHEQMNQFHLNTVLYFTTCKQSCAKNFCSDSFTAS